MIGSTGLVGSECVKLLIADPDCSRVIALVRNQSHSLPASAKLDVRAVNFDDLESHASLFAVDQIICCLGTTVRKTPSRDAYRKIDYGYPMAAARLGKDQNAKHYLVVTAIGASSKSRIFYNRLKGELEESLMELDYRSLTIVRPSVLIGDRSETRRSEKLAWKLAFITPRKYKPVPVINVARALVRAGREDAAGVQIIPNEELLTS